MRLRTAFWNYDRTAPLLDGRVRVPGVDLDIEVLPPEETFARAYDGNGFDLCEASFSNTATSWSEASCPYVLLPAFLSRAFRHSAIYIRTDRDIAEPSDLRGKTIALQEYAMTAAVVVRGLLRDHYRVDPSEMTWLVGDCSGAKPPGFPQGTPPDGVRLLAQPEGLGAADALLAGTSDAAILLRVPASVTASASIRPLFADPVAAERAWFRQAGIFPIMHAVALRRDLDTANPGLAATLYAAFLTAKDMAVRDLEVTQVPKVTLPWPHHVLAETRALMGPDYWSYGLASNRAVLEAQLRWSRQDGLQRTPVMLGEMFAAGCHGT